MRVQRAFVFLVGFVVVAGCSGQSQKKTDVETLDENDPVPQSTDNLDASIAQFMSARQLKANPIDAFPSAPPGLPGLAVTSEVQAVKWQSKPLGQQGQLLQSDEKANVIFAGSRCMQGGSCGCNREMKYFFGKASDGHIVIIEPKPNVHTRTVIRPGSCGYGCGQPSPPQPPAYFELPVSDMKLVEFVEVPFELWDVVVTCENPIPRP